MNQLFAVSARQTTAEPAQQPRAAAPAERIGFRPEDTFELIERTADTVRILQETNQALEAREQAMRLQFERDRETWRGELQRLKQTVEASLERANAAEIEIDEAKTRTEQAMKLCEDAQARESAALRRAESAENRATLAEDWLHRLHAVLTNEFGGLGAPQPR